MGSWCVAASAAAALLCCCALAQPHMELDKRSELSPVPFVMGSRYGRSPAAAPRLITPRNDRFFMGSRYGKRSLPPPSPPAPSLPPGGSEVYATRLICYYFFVGPMGRRHFECQYGNRKSDENLFGDGDEE